MPINNYDSQLSKITNLLVSGEAVFFLAAGASFSAGAPLWKGLKEILFDEIFSHKSPEMELLKNWIKGNNSELKEEEIKTVLDSPESIFSIAEQAYGKAYLESFLGNKYMDMKVSKTYEIIRTLCRIGIINNIFTTNQDGMLENSLMKYVSGINVIYPFRQKPSKHEKTKEITVSPYAVNIFNLHGSYYKPDSILTGTANIVGDEEELYKKYGLDQIQGIVNKYKALIVVGYGGLDKDICFMFKKFNKKGKKIFWTQYKNDEVLQAKNMRTEIIRIDGSDDFFSDVYNKINQFHKNSYSLAPWSSYKPNYKQTKNVVVYGSIAPAGEYGVYYNGKMIQYTLNMPCHFEAVPAKNWEVKISNYDPIAKSWKKNTDRSSHIKVFLEKEFKNEKDAYQITIKSTFPLESGLGDPEPAGLTKLLTNLGLLKNQKESWQFFRACASHEKIYYAHTSYLRPLASMLMPGTLSLFKRATLAPDGDYRDVNFLNTNTYIELGDIDYKILNYDCLFAIGYLPRGLTLEGEKAKTTGTGQSTVLLSDEKKNPSKSPNEFVKILAGLEERMEEFLENEKVRDIFGDILSEIRDVYSAQKRCRKSEQAIISKLKENSIIDGGKISGSGPGGGIVLFKKAANIYPLKLVEDIYNTVGRYMCLLEISKPQKNMDNSFRSVSELF